MPIARDLGFRSEQNPWPAKRRLKNGETSVVKLIIENGLLPGFYESCLISPATIRNRLGDAHGRGPEKRHEPNTDQADHMINLVCSNILFLRKMVEL